MRLLRFFTSVLTLSCSLFLICAAQTTRSTANVGLANGSCENDSGLVSGATKATCSRSYQDPGYYSTSGTSAAVANYSGLAIGGNATVTLEHDPGGANASADAGASAFLYDYLYPANFPASSFLFVAYAITASPTGAATGSVTGGQYINGPAGISQCGLQGFGTNSCATQLSISTGDSVELVAYLQGIATANCNPPSCGGAASGFEAGYKTPGGGSILVATIVDGSGNPIKGAAITSASGHKYPSRFASTSTLTASPNPSTQGQSVTFTATVASVGRSGNPTGAVTFMDSTTGATLGKVKLNAGVATLTTSVLAAGTQTITATYSGDNWSVSSHTTVSQDVN